MTINKYGIDETFIGCDCGSEVLRVTYEPWRDKNGNIIDDRWEDLDIAIFSLPGAVWTWRNRLRCI
jgi:hypothetical protein